MCVCLMLTRVPRVTHIGWPENQEVICEKPVASSDSSVVKINRTRKKNFFIDMFKICSWTLSKPNSWKLWFRQINSRFLNRINFESRQTTDRESDHRSDYPIIIFWILWRRKFFQNFTMSENDKKLFLLG